MSRPPPQSRKGTTRVGTLKAESKSFRAHARSFALQALYQYLVGKGSADAVDQYTRSLQGFRRADAAHYDILLHGCIEHASALDALIEPQLDRPLAEISPIEHIALWIGAYELQHCPEIPWRVVMDEAVELAKEFGGTDGYKYVNGILEKLARQLRSTEITAGERSSA